jgi:hypothetical protein
LIQLFVVAVSFFAFSISFAFAWFQEPGDVGISGCWGFCDLCSLTSSSTLSLLRARKSKLSWNGFSKTLGFI